MTKIEGVIIKNEQKDSRELHSFSDEWGPEKVTEIYDADAGLEGILIIDNTILGPGCGGIRISQEITPLEIFQLARNTTWKCALFDIPLGGAAAGIKGEPVKIDKAKYVRAFARKVLDYVPHQYIAAPELNTGMEEMAAFAEEVGNRNGSTGKTEATGGIPYELGTVGFGIGIAIEATIEKAHAVAKSPKNISEAAVAICGFDRISCEVAKYIASKKSKIVAISDAWGACYKKNGFELSKALKYGCSNNEKKSIKNYKGATPVSKDEFLSTDCDLIIFTDYGHVLTGEEAKLVKAKYAVEGVDNCISNDAELILHRNGVLVVPDILATAGRIISSYAECNGWKSSVAFSVIESKIEDKIKLIISKSLEEKIPLRSICVKFAQDQINEVIKEGK